MAEPYTVWNSADYIKTEEDARRLLEAAADEDPGDGSVIRAVLNAIVRAQNMSALARDADLNRANLYKALSEEGNPSLATVMKVTRALGLRLKVQPAEVPGPSQADAYTYRVVWSIEEPAYLGLCVEYPELSFLDSTSEGAFAGIRRLVSQHVEKAA